MLKSTLGLLLATASAFAGQPVAKTTIEPEKEKSIFDQLWAYPTLYKNPDGTVLNELRIVGRFNADQYIIDSDQGHDQDWIIRRLRVGLQAVMFKDVTARVELDLNPQDPDPFYSRLTEAYLSWRPSKAFRLTVGKHSAKFTLDGAISSNELLTLERNNLSNNLWFTSEYIPGVSVGGEVGNWVYSAGVFSGGTETPEFGNFDAGNFALASIGYDFGKSIGVKKALVRADYVYNDRNTESTFARSFEHIGSLVFMLDAGKWGVSTDASFGSGFGRQGDVYGFAVMPWYQVTDRINVVARYTYLNGDTANSVRFSRYESQIESGRGDEYSEFYAGLSYFIYGHKLKLQTGLAYTTMHDRANDGGEYAGWSWTTGLRMNW